MRKIFGGTAAVAGGNIVAAILLALFMAVAAGRTEVAQFGLLASFYSGAVLFADFTDFGTGFTLIVRSAVLSPRAINTRVYALVFSRLLLHVVGLVVLLPSIFLFIPSAARAPAVAAWLLSVFVAIRVLMQARERTMRSYLLSSALLVLERSVALGVLLILPTVNAALALLALAAGAFFAGVLGIYRTVAGKGRVLSLITTIKGLYAQARHNGVNSVGSSLNLLEVPLVSGFAGAGVAGLYAVPARLLSPVTFVSAALSAVLVRELPALKVHARRRLTLQLLLVTAGLVGAIAILLLVVSRGVISVLLGSRYVDSVPAVEIAAFTAVAVSIVQLLQVYLQSSGDSAFVARTSVAFVVVDLALVVIGAVLGGVTGAACGGLTAQLISAIVISVRYAGAPRNERGVT